MSILLQVAIVDDITLLIVQCIARSLSSLAGLSRVGQKGRSVCVGRVDATDIRDRPREYNRWMNLERLRSRQSSQRLRLIEIRRMVKVGDTSPICTDYSHRSTSRATVSIEWTHVFVISLCVSAGTLTETAAYIPLDEHDHINVGEQLESYTRMFQHGVPRETWQYIIMQSRQ